MMTENWYAKTGAIFAVLAGEFLAGCTALPKAEPQAELAVRIARYSAQAARVRGLAPNDAVTVERETRGELLASFEEELEKSENRVFLDDLELLLRQFRVLDGKTSLHALYLRLMGDQVAAYYDAEKKRLVYVDAPSQTGNGENGGLPGMERFVYVHEFCHALEDAHFGLEPLMRNAMGDLDSNLALTSFSEGNAVLAGLDGLLDDYGLPANSASPLIAWATGLAGRFGMERAAADLQGVPPFLASALLRPYLDGTVFSNRLRRDAGWGAIDRAYTSHVPGTTADILYPERRYLRGFRPAAFDPDPELLRTAARGVSVNRLGPMGIALWLNGDDLSAPSRYGFLKGWLGDRVYLLKGEGGAVQMVWLSFWERPGMARAFCRQAGKKLRDGLGEAPCVQRREGRLVALVWDADGASGRAACERLAELALRTRVQADGGEWASLADDLPWPVRFPAYPGFSAGCDVLGGYAFEACGGEDFFRASLGCGLVRAERNPDRHYYGALWGLARHVGDARSDFTCWKVPLLASWHRRGQGEEARYRWSLLWGLLADGTERRARLFFIPVWREGSEK
jgi:hypothetical protein